MGKTDINTPPFKKQNGEVTCISRQLSLATPYSSKPIWEARPPGFSRQQSKRRSPLVVDGIRLPGGLLQQGRCEERAVHLRSTFRDLVDGSTHHVHPVRLSFHSSCLHDHLCLRDHLGNHHPRACSEDNALHFHSMTHHSASSEAGPVEFHTCVAGMLVQQLPVFDGAPQPFEDDNPPCVDLRVLFE